MDRTLQLFLVLIIVFFLFVILFMLKKKRLNLRYTLLWLFSAFALLIFAVFPNIVTWLSEVVGIMSPVNTVFVLEGVFVLVILLSLTGIVSSLNGKLYRLTQKQALLEKRIRELEDALDSSTDDA